jgi:hypothetical protein
MRRQQLIRRMFALLLLLAVNCSRPTSGHNENNEENRHLQPERGDLTAENDDILNPLRQTDFVEQQECVYINIDNISANRFPHSNKCSMFNRVSYTAFVRC